MLDGRVDLKLRVFYVSLEKCLFRNISSVTSFVAFFSMFFSFMGFAIFLGYFFHCIYMSVLFTFCMFVYYLHW